MISSKAEELQMNRVSVRNIAETLKNVVDVKEHHTALVEAKTGNEISFSELDSRSDGYAAYLQEKGLFPGTVVILMVTPSIEFICLTFALFKLGTPVVLIDPGMGYKNLLNCIERVRAQVLIGIPKALLFKKCFHKPFRTVQKTFCCGKSFGLLGPDIRDCVLDIPGPFPVFQPGKEDLAAIIFTTGSTGPPKGVRYEHSVFAAQLRLIRDYYGIGFNDIDQPAFPLFALFSTALGACSIIPDMDATQPAKVDPEKFVASVIKHNVSYSFGSPAIWNVVSKYCLEKQIVLDSITQILMAGAPVPYDLLRRVASIIPPKASISTPYGATESLPIASIKGSEILADTWAESVKGKGTCVGKALPGLDIRIVKITDKPIRYFKKEDQLGPYKIGEIIVKGDVVTKSYENNPAETLLAKIVIGDELWHRMGDVGYIDERARLWFCGRKAHRVRLKGGTLYTIPCEAIINEHPDVYRSALVGFSPQKNGIYEAAVIIVEPHKNSTIDRNDLINGVKALSASSDVTRKISHFLVHHSFPVDIRHNAKIFREKLAVWAQKKLSPQV